jgi:hypothetical protein
MEVTLVNNPLKQVKFKGTYKIDGQTEDNKFHINIVPAYMDLNKGIWNVALDTYCYLVKEPNQLETVFDVKTSLVTGYEYLPNSNQHISTSVTLGNIYAVALKTTSFFGNFDRKWFTVENGSGYGFELILNQHYLTKQVKVEMEFEVSFLFQRIK